MNGQSPAGPADGAAMNVDRPGIVDLLRASLVGVAGLFGAIAIGIAIAMS